MSLEVEHLFDHLEADDVTETPTSLTYKSVHEIAFELIVRSIFIFELPLVDDGNKIWINCTTLFFALCIKANLTCLQFLTNNTTGDKHCLGKIIKTSCPCYLPKPKAEADNTDLGFDNS